MKDHWTTYYDIHQRDETSPQKLVLKVKYMYT